MEATVYDKLRDNVDRVCLPAIDDLVGSVRGMAKGTQADAALSALNTGFLAGIQYSLSVCESERAIDDIEAMKSFLCDVAELALFEASGI